MTDIYDPGRNQIRQFLDGVQRTYTIGDFGEVTVSGTDVLTYDHFCNLKTWSVGVNTTSFDWDFEGNLLKIDYPGTSNDDTHEYDGNGLRMRSKLSGAADWTNFVTDEVTDNLLAEYVPVSGTPEFRSVNTWGAGLLWTNREGTKRYFHFDGEGSTRALTDSSQATTDTYLYNRFGVLDTATGSSVNPFRWTGESGAYDDGARGSSQGLLLSPVMYAPLLGRAISNSLDLSPNGEVGASRRTFCVRDYECPVDVPSWIVRWIRRYKHLYCRACEADCVRTCNDIVPWDTLEFNKIEEMCYRRYLICMLRAKWEF